MKIKSFILIATVSLFLFACKNSNEQKNAKIHTPENLYKKFQVSKMIQYAHDLAFVKADEIGRPIQTTYFNNEGQILKIERYDNSGNICDSKVFSSQDAQPESTVEPKQLENDSLTVKSFSPSGELINKTTHTYNNYGQKTSMLKYDNNGKLIDKITYTYYENGLIKQDVYWNTEIDKPEQIINYKYEFY